MLAFLLFDTVYLEAKYEIFLSPINSKVNVVSFYYYNFYQTFKIEKQDIFVIGNVEGNN